MFPLPLCKIPLSTTPLLTLYPLLDPAVQDLDQLRRLLEPIVMQLERTTAAGAGLAGRDVASLALLLRRTKEYLSML